MEASKLGELYVSVGSDKTVYELKNRPTVFNENERKFMVEALRCVHQAFIGSGNGILDFIPELEKVQPDIFVVNTDGDSEKKRDYIESKGIQYIVLNREPERGLPARSTTTLRQQLKK